LEPTLGGRHLCSKFADSGSERRQEITALALVCAVSLQFHPCPAIHAAAIPDSRAVPSFEVRQIGAMAVQGPYRVGSAMRLLEGKPQRIEPGRAERAYRQCYRRQRDSDIKRGFICYPFQRALPKIAQIVEIPIPLEPLQGRALWLPESLLQYSISGNRASAIPVVSGYPSSSRPAFQCVSRMGYYRRDGVSYGK
jgi:hypothetical protein